MKIHAPILQALRQGDDDPACLAEDLKLDVALALERQRRRAGISYKQLAEALSTSAAYISKVFRGDSNLTLETLVKLAHAAGGRVEIHVEPRQPAVHTTTQLPDAKATAWIAQFARSPRPSAVFITASSQTNAQPEAANQANTPWAPAQAA